MSERKITQLKKKLMTLVSKHDLISTHKELAEHLFDASRYLEALDHFKEALSLCTRDLQMAKIQRLIGEVYIEMNKPELAEPYLRKYMENAQSDIKELQKSQLTLGRHLYIKAVGIKQIWPEGSNQMLYEAKKLLDQALITDIQLSSSEQNEPAMLSRIYLNLGLVAEEFEGPREAAIHLRKARTIAVEKKLHEDEFKCLSITATLFRRHGGPELAMAAMEGAGLQAAMRAGVEVQCQHAMDYSDHLIADSKLEEAVKVLKETMKIRSLTQSHKDQLNVKYREVKKAIRWQREIVHQEKLMATIKLAKFYCSVEFCHTKAIDILSDRINNLSLSVEGYIQAQLYKVMGNAYKMNNQFSNAIEMYEKAMIYKRSPSTLRGIALCKLRTNRPYNEVMRILEESASMEQEAKGYRTSITIDYMIYTRRSFGMPVDDLKQERENLESEDESSDDDDSESVYVSSNAESDDDTGNNEKIELSRNNKGETPLHLASAKGLLETVKKLIHKEKHAINVRDFNGWLPLHEAVNHNRLEVVKFLLDNGAAINDRGADEATTPLHDACQNGLLDIIQLLLDYGANPCNQNTAGLTPLDVLHKLRVESECSNEEMVKCEKVEKRMLEIIRKAIPDYQIKEIASPKRRKRKLSRRDSSNYQQPGNVTDTCKTVLKAYRDNTFSRPVEKRNLKEEPSAFVTEEVYNKEFTVPDHVVEFVTSSSCSPQSSPEAKEKKIIKLKEIDRIRVIAQLDVDNNIRLLVPFEQSATIGQLKTEIENRIKRRNFSCIDQSWTHSDLLDINNCLLDETDIIRDTLPNNCDEFIVKIVHVQFSFKKWLEQKISFYIMAPHYVVIIT